MSKWSNGLMRVSGRIENVVEFVTEELIGNKGGATSLETHRDDAYRKTDFLEIYTTCDSIELKLKSLPNFFLNYDSRVVDLPLSLSARKAKGPIIEHNQNEGAFLTVNIVHLENANAKVMQYISQRFGGINFFIRSDNELFKTTQIIEIRQGEVLHNIIKPL